MVRIQLTLLRDGWIPLLILLLLSGCMSWTPGWEIESRPPQPVQDSFEKATAKAEKAFWAAENLAQVEATQKDVEALLRQFGERYRILRLASEIEILRGAAFESRRGAKAERYRQGLQYAERAMATHHGFRAKIEAGTPLGEAIQVLGPEQGEALLLWVTGVSYYFKECLSGLGHLLNYRWMLRTSEVMDHLSKTAPDLQHGAVPFSMAIYYIGLPPSAGGDLALAEDYLDRAVDQSGTSLLSRWGRAKYLWVKTGNREGFEADLEWVLAQEPRKRDSPTAWNLYFQRDARAMLDQIEDYF